MCTSLKHLLAPGIVYHFNFPSPAALALDSETMLFLVSAYGAFLPLSSTDLFSLWGFLCLIIPCKYLMWHYNLLQSYPEQCLTCLVL